LCHKAPSYAAPLTAVGLISAAALAYEILLTRVFALIHWHHLVATAISLALLGYGASGTFLAVFGQRLHRHFALAFIANALLFSLSSVICIDLAQRLPFDPQALAWDWQQLFYLAGTFLVLAFPFFAASNCIGLSLWHFRKQIPLLYGYDLIGAGLGAVLLLAGLAILSPADSLFGVFLVGVLVAVSAATTLHWHPRTVTFICLLIASLAWVWGRPDLQAAAYKDLARAVAIMGATIDHQSSGITGTLSVVRNNRVAIRQAPGLSLHASALPPKQLAVFVDGDLAGTMPADRVEEQSSAYLRDLTSALPYALLTAPRVAVLNAGVGMSVEQAVSLGAASVSAVEPNSQLYALVCEQYRQTNAGRCGPKIEWQTRTSRLFLADSGDTFDLITLSLEADPSGLNALRSSYELTSEALVSGLERLSPHGILAIDGPTRHPPRLSLRTINTAYAALTKLGVEAPARHIAVIRGWQRFTLLASPSPLDAQREVRIRAFARTRGFDLVWLPKIQEGEANRYQKLSKAWYYLGAAAILGTQKTASDMDGRFRLQAASDDIPFPHRFTRWSEWWSALCCNEQSKRSQLDTGLFVATATLFMVTVGGVFLIIVPLFRPWKKTRQPAPYRLWTRTLLYFCLVGVAFVFIELAWIQRLQQFLGHPVYATTAVLVAFLLFAGLGSLWSQKRTGRQDDRALMAAVTTILLTNLIYIFYMPSLLTAVADLPLIARGCVILVLLAPLAFAMGIPFPTGLKKLGDASNRLVPWAWGINGVASVIAAAAAPLLAMEIGFSGLLGIAMIAYLILPAIRPGDQKTS